jgi:hypothetical protein
MNASQNSVVQQVFSSDLSSGDQVVLRSMEIGAGEVPGRAVNTAGL